MRPTIVLAAATLSALAAAALPPVASTAQSAPAGRVVIARGLVGPLSLDVGGGRVYVTQNFASELDRVPATGGNLKALYHGSGNEVGGVSVRHGRVVFTETASSGPETPTDSWVKILRRSGGARTLAHVWAYEEAHNPDGARTYGVRGISDDCAAQWPTEEFGPPVYHGLVDSHPYKTFQRKHKVYVADAGMNAILSISLSGRIRTVDVLPAVPVPITQELATSLGAPDCVVGMTYYGEPVPTDVEMGPGGRLLVTTLGGGLGEQLPLGALYRINPMTGHRMLLADKLMTPTDLAVLRSGRMLVAELFANRIVSLRAGSSMVRTFARAHLPATVEVAGGHVYATIDALPPDGGAPDGKVVRFRR